MGSSEGEPSQQVSGDEGTVPTRRAREAASWQLTGTVTTRLWAEAWAWREAGCQSTGQKTDQRAFAHEVALLLCGEDCGHPGDPGVLWV